MGVYILIQFGCFAIMLIRKKHACDALCCVEFVEMIKI